MSITHIKDGKRQPRRSSSKRRNKRAEKAQRKTSYHKIESPFSPVSGVTQERVEAIHETALRILQELGIKVLLPEARSILNKAGARVDEENQMAFIGADLVEEAIKSAPKSIHLLGGCNKRDVFLQSDSLTMFGAGGCPNATDLKRGRRPGSLRDFRELTLLNQHFDVINYSQISVEPQDVPNHLRHYSILEGQLTLSDKVPFIYSRGKAQVEDCFEMLRIARGFSPAEFEQNVCCYTIINTNSPRQIDIPMGQGIIDFARYGQMVIITPFTLMGAMAPITPAGALVLSHAEALAALTLSQLTRPGAPVCYGTFTSNVDMKSGSPALGTPEQFKANLIAGQLARHIGLPWRSASGSAANINDVQAAHETQMGLWGSILSGANIIHHAAGWLESGLTVSYEKFITDVEILQILAESSTPIDASDDALGFDALQQVEPGGHFFSCDHTMARYQTEFYQPIVHDWSNFGNWTEQGAQDANQRATAVWQAIVDAGSQVQLPGDRDVELADFIKKRTTEGGAVPES